MHTDRYKYGSMDIWDEIWANFPTISHHFSSMRAVEEQSFLGDISIWFFFSLKNYLDRLIKHTKYCSSLPEFNLLFILLKITNLIVYLLQYCHEIGFIS